MARTSRDEWARRIARWRESGLSGRDFAARIGVKEATLRHWKWLLGRDPHRDESPHGTTPTFIEVASAAVESEAPQFELLLPGELRLRIPSSFDAAALRRLLAVLAER